MLVLLLPLLLLFEASPGVVDFERENVFIAPGDKAHRMERYEENGVVFALAHAPRGTKAKGFLMIFEHLTTGHKGIGSAMAQESIPVRATFPKPVDKVTVSFFGSTATPVVLEALDAAGKVIDKAELESAPARKSPADAVPVFRLSVSAPGIVHIQFSGPRPGEYLAADEVVFTGRPGDGPR